MVTQEIELAVTDVAELVAVRDGFRRLTSAQETAIISIDGLLENSGDIDSNVDDFRFQIVDGPTSGMATVNEGFVEFTPFEGFEGTDSFTYRLVSSADGTFLSEVATITLERSPETPEAPQFRVLPDNPPEREGENVANEDDSDGPTNGTSVNPVMAEEEDDDEFGLVQSVPTPIELEAIQRAVVEEDLDSRAEDARADLLLDYQSNGYSYAGRTQFLDLAKQELSVISSEALQSTDDFSQQLSLRQFVVGPDIQNKSSLLDVSNLDLGDLTPPILGAGMLAFAIVTAATLTSSQIPRVLDVGVLLDDEESIEEIVSS